MLCVQESKDLDIKDLLFIELLQTLCASKILESTGNRKSKQHQYQQQIKNPTTHHEGDYTSSEQEREEKARPGGDVPRGDGQGIGAPGDLLRGAQRRPSSRRHARGRGLERSTRPRWRLCTRCPIVDGGSAALSGRGRGSPRRRRSDCSAASSNRPSSVAAIHADAAEYSLAYAVVAVLDAAVKGRRATAGDG